MVMKTFLNRPIVKNLLMGSLTLIIGGICSSLGSWNAAEDKYFIPKILSLVISSVVYIAMLIFYTTGEVNYQKMLRVIKQQNKAFEEAMVGIISICEQSSQKVNTIIHEIVENGKINLNIWNFDIGCRLICEKIYHLLCNLHGESKDFGVSYVKLVEDGSEEVYMNAYFNQNLSEPSVHRKRRKINDKNGYHDVELFQTQKSDMEIVIGKENIQQLFNYKTNESRRKNKDKYNQYIAIPVFCSKDDGGKMVGLLEIVCLNSTELAKTEEEIREIASKYFVPYTYIILLLHKLEKALVAKPNIANN